MKLRYEAPKRARYKSGKTRFSNGCKASVFMHIDLDNTCNGPNYWYEYEVSDKWMLYDDIPEELSRSTCAPCKSVKAFRRKLKKWSKYLPKGTKFILASKIVGNDVYGRI